MSNKIVAYTNQDIKPQTHRTAHKNSNNANECSRFTRYRNRRLKNRYGQKDN